MDGSCGHLEYLVKPAGLPYAEASWERTHTLRAADALEAIAKYHEVCGIPLGSLGGGTQHAGLDPTAWLKPGMQVEVAGAECDKNAGGSWKAARVLEAGGAAVLVEGKKEKEKKKGQRMRSI